AQPLQTPPQITLTRPDPQRTPDRQMRTQTFRNVNKKGPPEAAPSPFGLSARRRLDPGRREDRFRTGDFVGDGQRRSGRADTTAARLLAERRFGRQGRWTASREGEAELARPVVAGGVEAERFREFDRRAAFAAAREDKDPVPDAR